MISSEFFFEDTEDETNEDMIMVARNRRLIRDSSNPLELPNNLLVNELKYISFAYLLKSFTDF